MSVQKNVYHEPLQSSYGLDFFVRLVVDKGSYVPEHFHDALEIIYIVEGEGQTMIGNNISVAGRDEFLLINPNIVHSTTSPFGDINVLIQLPVPYLTRLIPDIAGLEFHVPKSSDDPKQQAEIESLKASMRAMKNILENPGHDMNLQLNRKVLDMLDLLYVCFSIPAEVDTYRLQNLARLDSILQYAQKNYRKPISIGEISEVVSLQPEYFCRFFKKCTGSTFLEYLNSLRISHIYNDILNTSLPILQIVESHGFTNYKLFHQMFKERFSNTPREIRKLQREHLSLATVLSDDKNIMKKRWRN